MNNHSNNNAGALITVRETRDAPYLSKIPVILRALSDLMVQAVQEREDPVHPAGKFLPAERACKILELDADNLPNRLSALDLLALAVRSKDTQIALRTIETAARIVRAMELPPAETGTFHTLEGVVNLEVIGRMVAQMRAEKRPREKESVVCRRLAAAVGGKPAIVEGGVIDILSKTEIIEVKRASEWRTGIGQLVDYSRSYPKHRKRLHLFGVSEAYNFKPVSKACAEIKARLTWEPFDGCRVPAQPPMFGPPSFPARKIS